jgi:diadenosine tetraphosphate (Ap4A) HIT family hydrolase
MIVAVAAQASAAKWYVVCVQWVETMGFRDFTGRLWEAECMGCGLAQGTMTPPGGMIAANRSCYLHQDPEVPLEAFLVIGTTRHVRSLVEVSVDEQANVLEMVRLARQLMLEVPDMDSVTVVQEERSAHFHLWLFPWYRWMLEKHGSASLERIRPIMAELKATAAGVRQVKRVLQWVERFRAASLAMT